MTTKTTYSCDMCSHTTDQWPTEPTHLPRNWVKVLGLDLCLPCQAEVRTFIKQHREQGTQTEKGQE